VMQESPGQPCSRITLRCHVGNLRFWGRSRDDMRVSSARTIVRREPCLLPVSNAHHSLAMTCFAGCLSAGRGSVLLDKCISLNNRCIVPTFLREGTQLAFAEMLRAGIKRHLRTCIVSEEAGELHRRPACVLQSPASADAPSSVLQPPLRHFEKAEQLCYEYPDRGYVSIFLPHSRP